MLLETFYPAGVWVHLSHLCFSKPPWEATCGTALDILKQFLHFLSHEDPTEGPDYTPLRTRLFSQESFSGFVPRPASPKAWDTSKLLALRPGRTDGLQLSLGRSHSKALPLPSSRASVWLTTVLQHRTCAGPGVHTASRGLVFPNTSLQWDETPVILEPGLSSPRETGKIRLSPVTTGSVPLTECVLQVDASGQCID